MLDLNNPHLKRELKAPFLFFIIIFIIIVMVGYFFNSAQKELNEKISVKDRSLMVIINQVKFLRHQKDLFLKYGSKYKDFLEAGLVSELDRVKWTDGLLEIQKKLALYGFKLQFEAENKLTKKDIKYLKIFKNIFYYSRLNFSAGVYTDLDVLDILSMIDIKITPLYLVKDCSLKGDEKRFLEPVIDINNPLFRLDCSLIILQAKPRKFKLK